MADERFYLAAFQNTAFNCKVQNRLFLSLIFTGKLEDTPKASNLWRKQSYLTLQGQINMHTHVQIKTIIDFSDHTIEINALTELIKVWWICP